ncbi:methionine/alanine import family NSS transporter small subunit [Kocuria sp.]|uniref:methionine/alanine import family NSS transporter small subunit n=1 Tax=Kocuria sp. TaxID=1871328 RepID=UPI0026DBC1A3|nr:methionine/alanine import family NSS transporter small subunit [Kocuria sp.]MDO4918370.1 methionine/alanine import family NSS transporter small subunit [Kocuria sp.]
MSIGAIIMMSIAMVTVWGGLALAVANIRRSPEHPDELDLSPEEQQRVPSPEGDAAAQRPGTAERV